MAEEEDINKLGIEFLHVEQKQVSYDSYNIFWTNKVENTNNIARRRREIYKRLNVNVMQCNFMKPAAAAAAGLDYYYFFYSG